MSKKFVCTVCGYIHEGDEAPAKCPQCGVPATKFNEMAAGGDRWLGGDDVDRKLTEYVYTQIEIQQGIDIRNLIDAMPDKADSLFGGILNASNKFVAGNAGCIRRKQG